ncbi:hypothetical protein [Pseudomonas syringae group genomosp. 3]|uniref:hypothetical protein n=1 Tax=Pseudomonas syringae group genomosp. 3 TaxID=251701 RepID=UPI000F41E24E|nr:hypothetical protein [Pseudomonas syringae group genomosp. 3]RMV04182.1 Structural protein P5 [Pseudomonas syringae pv. tomato]TES52355.1 hypothetical protein E2N91_29915 [Pseudomonas syringae pv. tomato]
MARIPIGPGAPQVMPEVQQNRVITHDTSGEARGAQQIANAVTTGALGYLEQQQREDSALAKVKASNSLLDRETAINAINRDLSEQVATGKLSYDKLEETYGSAVSKLEPLQASGLDPTTAGELERSAKRMQIKGLEGVQTLKVAARKDSAAADLTSRMDLLGKDAAMPGANIDQINARMDAEDIDIAGHLAYGEQWQNRKQQFKDNNWTTHATQRVVEARDNLGTMQKIQNDLTSGEGFYAGKLDPEKRTQLLNTITGRIYQIKEHNERQAEIRENKAERALTQMDRQAATGIPPTPADQQRWQSLVSGTSAAGEFKERINQMAEVQGLLRQPIEAQQQYVDQKRQQMAANGGGVAEQANLNRLQSAIDTNVKLMKTDPLSFSALRTGSDVEPIDLSQIGTPEGQQALGEQIASRFDVTNAVRKKYGPEVSRVPFKAQELEAIKAGYEAADDKTKISILAAVGGAAPTGPDAAAAIKAIAPEQPITLLAGMAQYRGLKATDGTDVAKTLMVGSKILKDKSVATPEDSLMQAAFESQVGNAMPGGTQQREQAYTGFKAIYAGLAEASGKRYDPAVKDVDGALAKKAADMITGGVTTRGGGWFSGSSYKVIKPYGMDDDAFDKAVTGQLGAVAASAGLSVEQLNDMPLSAVPGTEGAYYLLNAGRIQLDPKTNQPVVVKVK